MAYQIVWTAEAENNFYSVIAYLKEHWSDHSAEKFAIKTIEKLERLASKPYIPKYTSQPNVQIAQLDRKNVVFFTIENDRMILLAIYPYKKDITKSKYY